MKNFSYFSLNRNKIMTLSEKYHRLTEQIPDEVYGMIQEEIDRFLVNRDNYRYSRLGVVLCLMHIPYKFKNRYFCSQFVAEILEHAGAVRLKKKNTLYLPHQLLDGTPTGVK
jgi:hypothetical protein